MPTYLQIKVTFLFGRYHGEEWPPSPARLMQAIIAGNTAGCNVIEWPKIKVALQWLETLEPPSIIASSPKLGFFYTCFSASNDTDSTKRKQKNTSVYDLVSKGVPLKTASRQILTGKVFKPRITGDSDAPDIYYVWSLPMSQRSADIELAKQICVAARNLLSLGWGIDAATADGLMLTAPAPLPPGRHYIPSAGSGGIELLCPMPGTLADIEAAYGNFRQRMNGPAVNAETRAKLYRRVRYRVRDEAPGRLFVAFELRDSQGEEWQSFRWEDGMRVAAWLRHAANRRFRIEEWDGARADAYVCGHTAKGNENHRLSYVPLPSVGHPHSDGRHRRALVVLPFDDDSAEESLAILHRMAGDPLEALDSDSPMAWLGLSQQKGERDGVLNHYLALSKEWRSVTPVVLHGRDHGDGKFRPRKAEKLILQAFAESGYPEENIDDFSYQPAPFWSGAGAARQAWAPKHLDGWPRYHVRVAFKQPIKGPVLVGIGRHVGLGIFAAAEAGAL